MSTILGDKYFRLRQPPIEQAFPFVHDVGNIRSRDSLLIKPERERTFNRPPTSGTPHGRERLLRGRT
jgi:hypothetical protein